jgi:ABC-type branched-subunit amino acid transport system substrate-binding protein
VARVGSTPGAEVRLGLVTSGGPLTESVLRGAEFGRIEANAFANLFGKRVELVVRSTNGDAETRQVGLELFRKERVAAVVGGTSDGSAEALRNAAREASGLFLNVAASADRLRGELFDRLAFHVHPSVGSFVHACVLWLLDARKTRFALVSAESAWGAEVEGAASALISARSGQVLVRERLSPSFADWASLLTRLRNAQPEAILIGLEPDATRAFLSAYRDAECPSDLAAVTSDPHFALKEEPAALSGIWPLVWHESLERYSGRELNGRFRSRFGRPLDGAAWATWAALKLLAETAVRADSLEVRPLRDFLESRLAFDGHKGVALDFREGDHELGQPLYIARPRRGTASGPGGLEIVGEVSREKLDAVSRARRREA